jgi:hypothetical protein
MAKATQDKVRVININIYYLGLMLVWLVYCVATLLAPAREAGMRYNLTPAQINLLRLTITVPLLILWLAATRGVLSIYRYERHIRQSLEGQWFRYIRWGLTGLLLNLMLPSLIALPQQYHPQNQNLLRLTRIISNYTSLVLYLLAFGLLLYGSKKFVEYVGGVQTLRWQRLVVLVGMAAVAVVYLWLISQNQYRSFSDNPLITPTYYLADWLIYATIFVPYVMAWLMGSWAIIYLVHVARYIDGAIYRRSFRYLAVGIAAVVLTAVWLQFLIQTSALLGGGTLGVILVIIYGLLLIMAVSYLSIARGAKELHKIENV